MVLPPRHAVYSKQHIQTWLHGDDYRERKREHKVLECIQEPGDVVYVGDVAGTKLCSSPTRAMSL